MSEFGYIPEAPEQSFGNNKGIFTPKDIYDLTRADKYTNYGQLELIETQTVSGSPTTLDFTSIKENEYNVLFMTISDLVHSGSTANIGFRYYESGVVETSGVYQYAQQRGTTAGSFTDTDRQTSSSYMLFTPASMNGGVGSFNAYSYFYNLGDSSKYSFATWHSFSESTTTGFGFGSGVLKQASTVDGIQIYTFGRTLTSGTVSLYGLRFS